MNRVVLLLCFPFLALLGCNEPEEFKKYVDTTAQSMSFYAPAVLPFGMVKIAPTTDGHYVNTLGWEAVGHDERHNSIVGFANLHELIKKELKLYLQLEDMLEYMQL